MDELERLLFEFLQSASLTFDSNAVAIQASLDALIANLEAQGTDVYALISGRSSNLINARVAAFTTEMERRVEGAVRQVAQEGLETFQRIEYGDDQLYTWQTGVTESGTHCPDCLEREDMEPMTMEEWQSVGLPRTGATICTDHCMCVLTRAD